MKPPLDAKIYQDDLGIYWMENENLLCSVCSSAQRTVEALKISFKLINEITEGKKVCLLTDTSVAGAGSEGAREFSISASSDHFNAMAMISSETYSTLLVNTFMAFNAQPVPMKIFNNEADARNWIKDYLQEANSNK